MSDGTSASADFFDGRSARPQRVKLLIDGQQLRLVRAGEPSETLRTLALREVRWPERTRHGARVAHIEPSAGGGELHAVDAGEWDRFTARAGLRDSLVVRSQQSWRRVLAAMGLLVALSVGGWVWGVPWAGQVIVALVPKSVDAELGNAAFEQIEDQWLKPSELPAARQAALRAAFDRAIARAVPVDAAPYRLEFRASRIGPNAFALPGGIIVMTDELVELVDGDDTLILGVLAHEYGHVRHRHGMRQLVQAGVLGAAAGAAFGDYSSVLAAVPVLLGTLGYSRDFEREADRQSIDILRANGHAPAVMVGFFERLAAWRQKKAPGQETSPLGIAFSSHPADAERIERFRGATSD